MKFRDFLEKSYSERNYDSKIVDSSVLNDLMSYAGELEGTQKLRKIHFTLLSEGSSVFNALNGSGGYSGLMIEGPHYIGIEAEDNSPLTNIITGYYGQAVVKKAFELGLGTCWIDLSNVPDNIKKELLDNQDMKVNYIIAVGYSDKKDQAAKNTFVRNNHNSTNDPYSITVVEGESTSGGRLGTMDIVYLDNWGNSIDYDELERRGLLDLFYYVRNAPSYKNQQPCRFIINGGDIIMGVLNPHKESTYTDAGIMMYMIAGMAYEMGIPGKWSYFQPEIQRGDGIEYAVAGIFNI